MRRTHDRIYFDKNTLVIKQSFADVASEISLMPCKSIADVGCAAGIFPWYLNKRFPEAEITGIEFSDSLIRKAKRDFPRVKFIKGDVNDRSSVNLKYDVITMLGVLSIFDNYKNVISNVISWLNPNGRLILHSMISDFDIDVIIKYKESSLNYDPKMLESGWNIISEKSLSLAALDNNAKIISSKPFSILMDLPKKDDVLRSWTELNSDGSLRITNALHITQPQKIVTIQKNN